MPGEAPSPQVSAIRAQRRSDTRERILEAAIDLLVERGYSGFSTRVVAGRAGVSQGALQHHFASRSALCVSAMSELMERISVEFIDATPPTEDPVARFGVVADRLLAVFRSPSFVAGLELRIAARTDPELRDAFRDLERELDRILEEGASAMFPELVGVPGFDDLIETALASVRGIAVANLDDDSDCDEAWLAIRRVLNVHLGSILEGEVR